MKYLEFIESCRAKTYLENEVIHEHHVKPKHSGGTDDPDNLIRLSISDHLKAHELLYEENKHPGDLWAVTMLGGSSGRYLEECRKLMGKISKDQWANPDFYEKMCKVRKDQATKHKDTYKKAAKKIWQNPEHRQKMIEARKKMYTPEFKQKIRDRALKNLSDPDYIAKYKAGMIKRDARRKSSN